MATVAVQSADPEELLTVAANIVNTYAQQARPANDDERTLHKLSNAALGGTTFVGIISRAKGIFQLESQGMKIDALCTQVENCTTTEALTDCVNHHDKKLGFMETIWKKCGTATDKMKKDLEKIHADNMNQFKSKYQAELKLAKKEMANSSMYWAVASAFTVVVSQAIQLVAIWKDIRNATNLIDDQVEKAKMRDQLDRLILELIALEKSVETWKELPNGRGKEKAFLQIQREINKVQGIQQTAFNSIDSMKFKINGQIQKLGNHQTTLIVNGVSGVFHFGLTVAQLATSANLLGVAAKTLGITAAVLLGVVQAANVGTYVITEMKITELRKVLQEYGLLDLELTRLTDRLTEIQTWADEQNFDEM